ncbi:MAG TPA: hypothetical protein VE591_08225 [Candidatus Acidoferrum sp.]|nr:hypothetical protein [Candidatus Acidoferrum sp.]
MERVLARRGLRPLVRRVAPLLVLLLCCAPCALRAEPRVPAQTFSQLGDNVLATMRQHWYVPGRGWRSCSTDCGAGDQDWGADSLTSVLYERWLFTGEPSVIAWLRELIAPAPDHAGDRDMWSDVPLWDAVAALRMYDVTHDPLALRHAIDDYAYVARGSRFAGGACERLDFQYPRDRGGGRPAGAGLKTLESAANRILAAVLLAQRVADARERAGYLDDARRTYAAVRRTFFDRRRLLYTVYAFDQGGNCSVLPQRFFASVNGVMIEAGIELARAAEDERYDHEARATAHALAQLADGRGVFTDLQAENDIVEPLVLAMAELARAGDRQAGAWIRTNAAEAALERSADGSYGRFFDGPAPLRATVFETNGGFGLMIAAAALAPSAIPEQSNPWRRAIAHDVRISAPGAYAFNGSGIAVIGTLGDRCAPAFPGDRLCESGHAHIVIDGNEMVDRTGIWQGKMFGGRMDDGVLFAWRWPKRSRHVITFVVGEHNGKEGSSFLDVRRVLILQ